MTLDPPGADRLDAYHVPPFDSEAAPSRMGGKEMFMAGKPKGPKSPKDPKKPKC